MRASGIAAHIRVIGAVTVGFAVFVASAALSAPVRALLAWDLGVATFLALVTQMALASTEALMRRRAAVQDAGRWAILAMVTAGAFFSLFGLTVVQKTLKTLPAGQGGPMLALIVATILLSWLLVHVMFALHYAHDYYGPTDDPADEDGLVGGLAFPGNSQPDYWDFGYFSFVVGMTCQVSDVQVSGQVMRRIVLAHGIVAFFFNTIILALTINILAGMI